MPGLLALLAHPDDEYFCGGLLAAAVARQVPIHLVYWTRGEGGGSPRRRLLWSWLPREWHPRAREARRSALQLGAASVDFLGAIDPPANPGLRAPAEDPAVRARLAALLSGHAPEIVVTHGSAGDYGHPAHRELHRLAREVTESHRLISFNATWPEAPVAAFRNAGDSADFILDSEPYLQQRLGIVRAHRSQRGVLASLTPEGTLEGLLEATRYEGYHCWSEGEERDEVLERLARWTT
jgi:LmbE family N-acetylglucosaminyl deacetylase